MRSPIRRLLFSLLAVPALIASPGPVPGHSGRPSAPAPGATTARPRLSTVRLVAFSDYHSHAVPFFSDGRKGQAGIARAVAALKQARKERGTLVISGGDMLSLGAPAWSDEYRCVEWPWLDGLVDVMALGNHELDYGAAELEKCRRSVRFPVLAANLVGADGRPLLLSQGKPYLVREVDGVRIGLIAAAGSDFARLVKKEWLPQGSRFTDPVSTVRELVGRLRRDEKVAAVVFIGHQHREDDFELARQVPGIDLILGSHSHDRGELQVIPGTRTRYISPYQYLTFLSRLTLSFREGRLVEITGRLEPLDETLPEDPQIAAEVARLQQALVQKRPERFAVVGQAESALTDDGGQSRESVIGNWATEVLRVASGTHVFFNTASSFRGAIPPGGVTAEDFYSAIPYQNRIATVDFTGAQLLDWLALVVSKRGSDGFSQQTGVRYVVQDGKPAQVQILADPKRREAGYLPLDPAAIYQVGTTDFQAKLAAGYKELFAAGASPLVTDQDVHEALLSDLSKGPVAAALDGRDGGR